MSDREMRAEVKPGTEPTEEQREQLSQQIADLRRLLDRVEAGEVDNCTILALIGGEPVAISMVAGTASELGRQHGAVADLLVRVSAQTAAQLPAGAAAAYKAARIGFGLDQVEKMVEQIGDLLGAKSGGLDDFFKDGNGGGGVQ